MRLYAFIMLVVTIGASPINIPGVKPTATQPPTPTLTPNPSTTPTQPPMPTPTPNPTPATPTQPPTPPPTQNPSPIPTQPPTPTPTPNATQPPTPTLIPNPSPTQTPATTPPNPNANLGTNFEIGSGNWNIGGWTINSGPTPSHKTGPTNGFSGAGKYAYFETSYPVKRGDTVTMEILIPTTLASCAINFAYHMYGNTMGTLQLITVKDANPTVVWEKSGKQKQGNQWIQTSLSIGAGTNITVQFVGIKGPWYRSDMALDEISFSACL